MSSIHTHCTHTHTSSNWGHKIGLDNTAFDSGSFSCNLLLVCSHLYVCACVRACVSLCLGTKGHLPWCYSWKYAACWVRVILKAIANVQFHWHNTSPLSERKHATAVGVFLPSPSVKWACAPMSVEFYDSQSLQTWWESSWCDYWMDIGEEKKVFFPSALKNRLFGRYEVSHSTRNIPPSSLKKFVVLQAVAGWRQIHTESCVRGQTGHRKHVLLLLWRLLLVLLIESLGLGVEPQHFSIEYK